MKSTEVQTLGALRMRGTVNWRAGASQLSRYFVLTSCKCACAASLRASFYAKIIIGERERANLVVQMARFFIRPSARRAIAHVSELRASIYPK